MHSKTIKTDSQGSVDLKYVISTPNSTLAKSIDKKLPTVLFLHPVYIASDIWHPQFADPQLRRFNLIALDLRAHGETGGQVNKDYGPMAAAEDIVKFMVRPHPFSEKYHAEFSRMPSNSNRVTWLVCRWVQSSQSESPSPTQRGSWDCFWYHLSGHRRLVLTCLTSTAHRLCSPNRSQKGERRSIKYGQPGSLKIIRSCWQTQYAVPLNWGLAAKSLKTTKILH